jgi:hypothetical protein
MSPEIIHCGICRKPIKVEDFKDALAKLRRHRKKYHPKAFRKSIKKGVATRKKNK